MDTISFCPAQGDVDAAKQAIWSGANGNQIDQEGKTPLNHAARFVLFGSAGDMARELIQADDDVDV